MQRWRVLAETSAGTSHVANGLPCQDAVHYLITQAPNNSIFLIAAVADGAGSAVHAKLGADQTVRSLINSASLKISAGCIPDNNIVEQCFDEAHSSLKDLALINRIDLGSYACTALLAVVGQEFGVMGQVGDGAIVAMVPGGLIRCIASQRAQYINETNFITEIDYRAKLRISKVENPQWIAMMSDGLEGLAISYADDMPLLGFFSPFIQSLSESQIDPSELAVPMQQFLASDRVHMKTDDDKTLLIAINHYTPT